MSRKGVSTNDLFNAKYQTYSPSCRPIVFFATYMCWTIPQVKWPAPLIFITHYSLELPLVIREAGTLIEQLI